MTFLSALFNLDEATCFSTSPKGTKIIPVELSNNNFAFFSINPMSETNTRADSSVTKYRNILIEMDKVTLSKQDQIITEIGMPYTTAVFSGSKSIHYIISLEQELPDEQSYRGLVKRVYKAVGNELVDQSCRNPSRFSRMPGHTRLDTGREQQLLAVNPRVSNETLEKWLISRGAPPEEMWENLTPEPRSTFKNRGRLYASTKNFLMYGAEQGQWNPKIFKAAADLCRCGFTLEEANEELKKVTGKLDFSDCRTIESAYKNELGKEQK